MINRLQHNRVDGVDLLGWDLCGLLRSTLSPSRSSTGAAVVELGTYTRTHLCAKKIRNLHP
jgi:hypothetical protein